MTNTREKRGNARLSVIAFGGEERIFVILILSIASAIAVQF